MFIAQLDHPDFGKFDFSTLRTGIMAGAPCPIEVMKRVVTDMHMAEVTIAYGMTETSRFHFKAPRTIRSTSGLPPWGVCSRIWNARSSTPQVRSFHAGKPANFVRAAIR
jgi:acyl-CoA synthetase (AMP-forming)/AMP-acid ligase II